MSKRRFVRLVPVVCAALTTISTGILPAKASAGRAAVTVTSTADLSTPCSPGAVSLRCAIDAANLDGNATIAFAIPSGDPGCEGTPTVCTIAPTKALPPLTASDTVIDGFTQVGSVPNDLPLSRGDDAKIVVRLDGSAAGQGVSGLTLAGPRDTVRGLSITGFISCFVCGPIPGQVTGGSGIEVLSTDDVVAGNFLGLLPDGLTAAPNQFAGVLVTGLDAGSATIGGIDPASTNVLSGNKQCSFGDCEGFGAYVDVSGPRTLVERNLIGTTASGRTRLPNAATGLVVLAARTTVTLNVISGSGGDAVLTGGNRITLSHNLIGTDAAGLRGVENHSHGIDIQANGNVVRDNVISHSGDTGLVVSGTATIVQGNRIGTDVTGTRALGNGFDPSAIFLGQPINGTDGIVLCGEGNTVGGSKSGQGNLVGGNIGNGIFVGAGGNVVQGNLIGTDATGAVALPNRVDGIGSRADVFKGAGFCQQAANGGGSASGTIGGMAAGAGNLVSGNLGDGIDLVGASNFTIAGNRIGTSLDGTAALGNKGAGVVLGPTCDDGVCTPSTGDQVRGNLVSANGKNGVDVNGLGDGTGIIIAGNKIGTDGAGHPTFGNGGAGIAIEQHASSDVVGGIGPSDANLVAANAGPGILIGAGAGDSSTHVVVEGNATFANSGLGIDLAPQGVIDCSTPPPGPNGYAPCPVIAAATTTSVSGTACPGCTVEVFLALQGVGDSGHGEGAKLVGRGLAASDGTWSIAVEPGALASGDQATATATTPVGTVPPGTSEFAANVAVS
jgi:parallel beta-helix repeat protein